MRIHSNNGSRALGSISSIFLNLDPESFVILHPSYLIPHLFVIFVILHPIPHPSNARPFTIPGLSCAVSLSAVRIALLQLENYSSFKGLFTCYLSAKQGFLQCSLGRLWISSIVVLVPHMTKRCISLELLETRGCDIDFGISTPGKVSGTGLVPIKH